MAVLCLTECSLLSCAVVLRWKNGSVTLKSFDHACSYNRKVHHFFWEYRMRKKMIRHNVIRVSIYIVRHTSLGSVLMASRFRVESFVPYKHVLPCTCYVSSLAECFYGAGWLLVPVQGAQRPASSIFSRVWKVCRGLDLSLAVSGSLCRWVTEPRSNNLLSVCFPRPPPYPAFLFPLSHLWAECMWWEWHCWWWAFERAQ